MGLVFLFIAPVSHSLLEHNARRHSFYNLELISTEQSFNDTNNYQLTINVLSNTRHSFFFEMIPSSLIDNPLDEDTPDHTHSFMKLLRYDEHQVDIESLLYWDKQKW